MALVRSASRKVSDHFPRAMLSRVQPRFGVMPWEGDTYRIAAVSPPSRKAQTLQAGTLVATGEGAPPFTGMGYRKGQALTLVIPRDELVAKTLRLPTRNGAQLARMMPFEARQLVPWAEEVDTFAYLTLNNDEEGYTTVLLFVVQTSAVQRHLDHLARVGIHPTRVEPSLLALSRIAGKALTEERPALYFSGGEHQEFVRYSAGEPVFTRGLCATNNQSGNLRDTLQLVASKGHGLDAPTCVYVVAAPRVVETIWEEFSAEVPVSPFGPVAAPPLSDGALEDALCIGGALGAHLEEGASDLMPPLAARRRQLAGFARNAGWTAGLILWLAGLLYLAGQLTIQREQRRLDAARAEIARLQEDNASLDADAKRIKSLEREFILVGLPLALVLDLYERTPQTVAISRFAYDSRGTLALGGEAYSNTEVMNLVTALQESPYYREVEPIHLMKTSAEGDAITEFKLRCVLNPGGVNP